VLRLLFLLLLVGLAAPAAARDSISLRESLCAQPGDAAVPRPTGQAPGCAHSIDPHDGWTWYIHPAPTALNTLSANWQLLFSVTRFDAVRVVVDHPEGQSVIHRSKRELGHDLAFGNHFRLVVPVAGRDVMGFRIGFKNLRDPDLFRSAQAMSDDAHDRYSETWRMVLTITLTVVGTSLLYNLFLYAGMGRGIRQWYAAWALGALGYMLSWSGAAFHLFPALASEWAKRIDLLLISMTVASGTMFFCAFMEPGKLPRWLVTICRCTAAFIMVCGALAAADPLFPAPMADRLLNIAFLASTISIIVGIGIAIAGRSRAVWFYVVGWSPPIAVFVLRIARNFDLVGRSDLVDFAGFTAFAFEAVVLSLAIGDRLRNLRRELDSVEAEREILHRVARTDGLTGLANRVAFQEYLAKLEVGSNSTATLFMVDLDYLKNVNDWAGHDVGDAMLIEAARRIRAAAGNDCLVARIGGDEFVIVSIFSARRNETILSALAQAQTEPWSFSGQAYRISFSIGHASWGNGMQTGAQLYKAADVALYEAKASGRGLARAYSAEMSEQDERRQGLARSARQALQDGMFEVHFQPVWDLRGGRVAACEALLRWRLDGELLGPSHFAELFDDPLTQAELQDFVLGTSLETVARAQAEGRELIVSVNFVASQLQGRTAARKILAMMARHGVMPSALCVEVTENVVLRRSGGPIIECLQRLREAGVRVALDDFGTGFASLVHLRDLPADVLKIDRSFVARLAEDESSGVIVQAVVALATGLGKRVVAEGIETRAQLDVIKILGCDYGQGYLLGRPAPWSELGPALTLDPFRADAEGAPSSHGGDPAAATA
jgi:diguanylate cyclase (GGDEF)-like protein